MAKWFVALGHPFDIHANRVFYLMCEKGLLEMAKWLVDLG